MTIMKVEDQAKIDLFQEIMPIIMQYLAAKSADQELIVDFFALSIASLIQNDTNLTTSQLQRKGSWQAHRALGPAFEDGSEQRGASLLAMTIGAVASDATPQ